ncbi:Uncharacterized protein FWK35_00033882, partial [Aphis craccivora]
IESWAALVIGRVVTGTEGAFGWAILVFCAFIREVIFAAFDAPWNMVTLISCVSVVLTFMTLWGTTTGFMRFLDDDNGVEERRDLLCYYIELIVDIKKDYN